MKDDAKTLNKRIEWVLILFIIGSIIIAGRLVHLQIIKHSFFKRKAQQMHLSTEKKQFGRGAILDVRGNKMAMSIKTESICVNPSVISNKKRTAAFLAKKLDMDINVVLRKLKGKNSFAYIERKVDQKVSDEILAKKIRGVFARAEEKRYYPMKESGAHVLGFTGLDNKGLEGIEKDYEKYLRGKIGRVLIRRDAKRRALKINEVNIKKAEVGANLHLTIDSTIQYYAHNELNAIAKKYNAKKGSVIVMNPKTGAIIALANYPSFDPNNFSDYSLDDRRNKAVTDIFEPGSTFKIFTMAAFLEEFPGGMEHKVHCGNGKQMFFDRYVHDHEQYEWLSAPEVIKYSSNIGIVSLALKIKQKDLYNEYSKFGFGKHSGIDVAGDVRGILRNYDEWNNTTLTSIPYGQEVAVTAMQLIKAYAIIANGGYDVTPYIVDRIEKNGKNVFKHKMKRGKRIIKKDIRDKLVQMLELVTQEGGTGTKAAIKGYRVGGKTGTAQKHKENGKGYQSGSYVASFVGFLPVEDPELLTLVVVDEPKPLYYGGDVAAPIYKKLNNMMISHLQILPGQVRIAELSEDENINTELFAVPDFYKTNYRDAKAELKDKGVKVRRLGFGHLVIAQEPKAFSYIGAGDTVSLYIGDEKEGADVRIYMPNVKGLSMRRTLEIMNEFGLNVKCVGSGIAVDQEPKPGVAVAKNKECIVNFDLKDEASI